MRRLKERTRRTDLPPMRWGFFSLAAVHGWRRIWRPFDGLPLAPVVFATFGIPTTIGVLLDATPLGLAFGAFAAGAVVVLDGAFELWRVNDDDAREVAQLEALGNGWIAGLDQFLEARAAERPEPQFDLDLRLRQIQEGSDPAPPDPGEVAAREAAEAFDRETVSLYIERFRDEGVALYDILVARKILRGSDQMRKQLRAPKSTWDISEMRNIIWLGMESDLREPSEALRTQRGHPSEASLKGRP